MKSQNINLIECGWAKMFKVIKHYEGSNNIIVEDEECGFDEFTLKWDGCVHYRKGYNGYKPREDTGGVNSDYIHICDIDEMIEKLQAIKELGKKHFKNEYWT